MKLNFSIRSFLVFLAICFTVPAVLLFGYFEARSGIRQAREHAREMNRQAALLIEHDIEATLEKFKALTEGLAVDVNLDKLRFDDVDRLKQVLNLYPDVVFFILNEKAVSVQTYSITYKVPAGSDYSERSYVKETMATRKTVISSVVTRDSVYSVVVFCVPLLDSDGVERGILAGSVRTSLFQTNYQLAPEQFALVQDAFGNTVSSINVNPSGPQRGDELNELRAMPVGWRVVVGLPSSYVMAGARHAIYNAFLVALICTLIGGAVASVVGFSTVAGLNKIGRQVQEMSALDLKPIELSATGLLPREVRRLIGNFNNLLDRSARMHVAEFEAISQMADTVLVVDAEGNISFLNDAGTRLFGEVRGKPVHDIIGREIARSILSQEPPTAWKGDAVVTRSQGETFDAFLSSTPVMENGKLSSAVIIVQDITKEKAAREAKAQSEKMITLGELVAGTSHELNNPLAIVTGYADLLLQETGFDKEQRAKIESIRKNAHRAANVVHSLLAFARKDKPERIETNLNLVVRAALQIKEYDLRTSNIGVEERLGRGLQPVFADPNQLQQVLLNILNNAQDAVLASFNPRYICITTEARDGNVCIKVDDSGTGISKEDLKKVFDPFFTTKPLGKGTGLGLSISYGIIREHGGEIEIQSQFGQGTQVSITLPAYSPLYSAPTAKRTVDVPPVPRKFLVVDDEVEIVHIIQKVLMRSGHTADVASNLAEALKLATANEYDFIISDIKMPGGSGIDFYTKLSLVKPAYKRRFIFLTGDTSNSTTLHFLEREGIAYFPKPFDMQVMETLLREAETQAARG
jgi:PAS domain S-box-containing protein